MGRKRKIDTSTLETLLGKHIPPVMQEMMDRISKSDHHKEWLTVYANNAVDDMLDVAGRILADQNNPDKLGGTAFNINAIVLAEHFIKFCREMAEGGHPPTNWRGGSNVTNEW